MAFLFDKRTKQGMKWIWIFFSIIIIFSMTLAFSGGQGLLGGGTPQQAPTHEQQQPPRTERQSSQNGATERTPTSGTTTEVDVDGSGNMEFDVDI